MCCVDRGTVDVYERRAADYRDRRPPRWRDRASAFAARCLPGLPRVDLGCGPGGYLDALGEPVIALDAAMAMLRLSAPRRPVRADLAALPFRPQSLGGAWARNSYLHVPRAELPMALAHLQWAMVVGAPLELSVVTGDCEGAWADDDLPGRFFAAWQPSALTDVLVGAGFTDVVTDQPVEDTWARAVRARTLPDTVGPDMRLLVCGLNPSVYSADAGVGYAGPSNRFWPAAIAAGLVSRRRDSRHALAEHGVGMTDLVKRATPRADELTTEEYRAGAERVRRLVAWLRPGVVVFVGLTGWRAAIDKRAVAGEQSHGFGGAPAYVMPSTSGLNAHVKPADLVAHLRAATALAGV